MARGLAWRVGIGAALAILTLIVFAPVRDAGFINYDDDRYVTENVHVRQGLTLEGLRWAWTTGHAANWHPLTWFSHMLDCELFGMDAGDHHLTSLVLHVINALLLFVVLDRMTGAAWRSAWVAAIFAIHPLHVESVAWVAERKDVLSTLFGLAALWAYARYARQPGLASYVTVFVLLALGLMAKPMLVSLPFLLLLLDAWPLARFGRQPWPRLVVEKLPLFGLGALSAAVTFAVQRSGGAMGSFEQYPLSARIPNAVIACATYLRKAIWPDDLAVFYPHPGSAFSHWQLGASAAVILAISVAALRWRRPHPALWTGWLWYLISLVPVLGLVQVGEQAMADRYTYVPLIGCLVALAWLVPDFGDRSAARGSVAVLASLAVVALAVTARVQVGQWRDSTTLFRHALEVTRNNYIAHNSLGVALSRAGREDEAARHFREALRLSPRNADAHYNLALSLVEEGRLDEALAHFQSATRSRPDFVKAHYNYGTLLAERGQWGEAVIHLSKVVELEPGHAEAHYNLGVALYFQGEIARAREQIELARSLGYTPPPRMLDLLREEPQGKP